MKMFHGSVAGGGNQGQSCRQHWKLKPFFFFLIYLPGAEKAAAVDVFPHCPGNDFSLNLL